MVSVHTSEQDWIKKIKLYTNDATLHSLIGKPDIPFYFMKVLHAMLSSCHITPAREIRYGVATTLLQMGLEIHDRIPTLTDSTSMSTTSRQLLVLSGDYYSSQYYRLMTKYQEIEGLGYLSNVICSMNEARVNLHGLTLRGKHFSVHEYPDLLHFTSGLLAALADFFHVEQKIDMNWKKILCPLLLLDFVNQRSEWLSLISKPLCDHIIEKWNEGKENLADCSNVRIRHRIEELYSESESWLKSQLLLKEG